jgi:hypothetical protein
MFDVKKEQDERVPIEITRGEAAILCRHWDGILGDSMDIWA